MVEVFDFEKFKKKKTGEEKKGSDKRDPLVTDGFVLSTLLYRKYPEDFGMGIVKKIFELTKNFNPHTLQERREVVKKYSAEELVRWLTEHHESEWAKYPNFYRAIAEEVKFRLDYSASKVKK